MRRIHSESHYRIFVPILSFNLPYIFYRLILQQLPPKKLRTWRQEVEGNIRNLEQLSNSKYRFKLQLANTDVVVKQKDKDPMHVSRKKYLQGMNHTFKPQGYATIEKTLQEDSPVDMTVHKVTTKNCKKNQLDFTVSINMNATQYSLNNNDAVKIDFEYFITKGTDPNTLNDWPRGTCITCNRNRTGDIGQREFETPRNRYTRTNCWNWDQRNWNTINDRRIFTRLQPQNDLERAIQQNMRFNSGGWRYTNFCEAERGEHGRCLNDVCRGTPPRIISNQPSSNWTPVLGQ